MYARQLCTQNSGFWRCARSLWNSGVNTEHFLYPLSASQTLNQYVTEEKDCNIRCSWVGSPFPYCDVSCGMWIIGERERTNLVVRMGRDFRYIIYLFLFISGAAYIVSNLTLHTREHAHVNFQSTAYNIPSWLFDMMDCQYDRQPSSSGSRSSTHFACESEEAHPLCVLFLYVYVCTRLLCATADSA